MTHTKELWEVVKSAFGKALILGEEYDNGRRVIASVYEDDAHNIVDCVNACAGLNPAAIPDVVAALKELVLTKEIHEKIWSKDMSVSKRERHVDELDKHKKRAFVMAEKALAALQAQS